MEIQVWPADERNMPELTKLFIEICREHNPNLAVGQAEIEKMFVKAFASNNKFFLAKTEGNAIGYLWISIETKKWNNKKVCMIIDMSVKKDFRISGIESKMIEYLRSYAQKEKCDFIKAEIPIINTDSIRFFVKQGFEESHKVVELKL